MIGRMVRAGSSPPMKVIEVSDGVARCILVDSEGRIRRRFHHINQLSPLWLSLQPKSCWPEITAVDQIADEREERLALEAKERERRASKKSKRSNKIKRRAPA
jgi:hypothetical protein